MLTALPEYIAWTRKAIIQVLGLVTSLLALGLLPDEYNKWAAGLVAVLTTVLHFITSNADAPGNGPALEPLEEEDVAPIPDDFKPAEVITASQVAAKNEQDAPPSP